MNIENYVLNSYKTLNELTQYGKIDGGGRYSIEYAYGNYIEFSPNNYKFIKLGSWYANRDIDYQTLLKNKIEYLIDNEIILKAKENKQC